MRNVSFPLPRCVRCRRDVVSLSAERQGGILVFTASCHGQTETIALPAQLLQDPNLVVIKGEAFKQVDVTA